MAKSIIVGAASGAVTVGLALLLLLMSKQSHTETERAKTQPPKSIEQTRDAAPPAQAPVRLQPPPAPARPAPKAPAERPPTAPRSGAKPEPAVIPLTPRQSARMAAASPATATPAAPASVTEGRALLRMLEAGKGPVIEIAWPAVADDRRRLYDRLLRCHGMRTAVLGDGGALYAPAGPAGTPWQVNRDEMSGFLRRPAGALTPDERALIRRIERRHGLGGGDPVRLFPRRIDAVLLGGLSRIVGADYAGRKLIRGRYRLAGGGVAIEDISSDGTAHAGRIVLPPAGTRGCA